MLLSLFTLCLVTLTAFGQDICQPTSALVNRYFENLENEFSTMKAKLTELETKNSKLQQKIDNLEDFSDHCPLGMEDKSINDSQISASSQWNSDYPPKKGRLNSISDGSGYAAWVPAQNTGWIQVDLLRPKAVTGVITQGRGDTRWGIQFVRTFCIHYGDDASDIQPLLDDNGNEKVFHGNIDHTSDVVNHFNTPIKARYVRIVVRSYQRHASMRFELLGC